jgi:uncharacterized protein YecE (DUF72 family)
MARILIGTSGWHYESWRGPFFPKSLLLKNQLQYYASQFPTAELNGVFYRTPTREAVKSWRDQTGKDFVFAWKASKFITHWKRLSDNSFNSLELLEDRLSLLSDKAGPILFQLPPQFQANAERLASFFKLLSKRRRYSFEFRHPNWYTPKIFRLLSDQNISLCVSDHHDAPAPWERTADFVYVRGHGPGGVTRDIIVPARWLTGAAASGPGRSERATSTSISITTRKVRRLPTRSSCASYSIADQRPARRSLPIMEQSY